MKSILEVNEMTDAAFVDCFGDVAEHSPWIARAAAALRPFRHRAAMVAAFENVLRNAPEEEQLALLRAHPDLASKARLTDDSAREQSRSGLTSLTATEFRHFTELNERYKAAFGFPFIFAVKGATKYQILASFEERIGRDRREEFVTAVDQVLRIFRFRIEDRVGA